MGNCASEAPRVRPAGTLTCARCARRSAEPWERMRNEARRGWVFEAGRPCLCRACAVRARVELLEVERRRTLYNVYKQEAYPPPARSFRCRLRSISDGKAWDDHNPSFQGPYRPPPELEELDREARAQYEAAADALAARVAAAAGDGGSSSGGGGGSSSGSGSGAGSNDSSPNASYSAGSESDAPSARARSEAAPPAAEPLPLPRAVAAR
jgi:hypothetical protein